MSAELDLLRRKLAEEPGCHRTAAALQAAEARLKPTQLCAACREPTLGALMCDPCGLARRPLAKPVIDARSGNVWLRIFRVRNEDPFVIDYHMHVVCMDCTQTTKLKMRTTLHSLPPIRTKLDEFHWLCSLFGSHVERFSKEHGHAF